MKKIDYKNHQRFDKQLKKLTRKYPSLQEDLDGVKRFAIELFHINKIDNDSVKLIPGFDQEDVKIYKIKKFACKSLKGRGARSGIRMTYAFYPKSFEVEFLEIYFKEKSDSDMDRGFVEGYLNER